MRLAVRIADVTAAQAAALSAVALDAPLGTPADLGVYRIGDDARLVGAFERAPLASGPSFRRGSGGATALVGPGTLHVVLSLEHVAALTPCDEKRIVNRHVRPLLRALTKAGALAHHFGRDWISVRKRPVALVAFGHDAATQRAVFEAIVAVTTPFADTSRASYLGKDPGTLAEIVGRPFDAGELARAIGRAYVDAFEVERVDRDAELVEPARAIDPDPPWTATREEAIGEIGARTDDRGSLRIGGELMASRDAIHTLEREIDALGGRANVDTVGMLVDQVLAAPGVALDGVRSLASIRDVALEAIGRRI